MFGPASKKLRYMKVIRCLKFNLHTPNTYANSSFISHLRKDLAIYVFAVYPKSKGYLSKTNQTIVLETLIIPAIQRRKEKRKRILTTIF